MAFRTTSELVKGVLGDDYGPKVNGTMPDLTPYIATANAMVNAAVSCQSRKGTSLGSTVLELMERWVAAHYYTKSDKTLASKSTGGASGSFIQGGPEPEPYKNVAIDLDPSGCLNALFKRQRAGVVWLGKNPSDQTYYKDRR